MVKAHCWVHCDLKKIKCQNREALCWATLNEFREIDNEDIVVHFVLMGWESSNILSQRGHPRKHFMFYSMYCLPPQKNSNKLRRNCHKIIFVGMNIVTRSSSLCVNHGATCIFMSFKEQCGWHDWALDENHLQWILEPKEEFDWFVCECGCVWA